MLKTLTKRNVLLGVAGTVAAVAVAVGASQFTQSQSANAAASIGAAAPGFTLPNSQGGETALSEFTGKKIILEWTNHDCPYVVKHYSTNNMQSLQTEMTGKDVVWLTIVSSAPGKQGHVSGEQANELTESRGASPTAVLLDESGEVGQLYGAKTTPHMFIIDEAHNIQYAGAIDDKKSSKASDVEGATNYVRQAMAEMEAGEAVSVTETSPYGCSVKY